MTPRRAAMHAALLGDLPVAGAGVKPLLQWQEAHRRRLMGSAAGARRACDTCAPASRSLGYTPSGVVRRTLGRCKDCAAYDRPCARGISLKRCGYFQAVASAQAAWPGCARSRASARECPCPAGAATPEEQTASVNWATSSAAWSTVIILIIFALFSCHAIANMRFKLVRLRRGARLVPGCGTKLHLLCAARCEWVGFAGPAPRPSPSTEADRLLRAAIFAHVAWYHTPWPFLLLMKRGGGCAAAQDSLRYSRQKAD